MVLHHTTRCDHIQHNEDHVITTLAHGKNSRANALNLTKLTCIHYSVQFMFLTDVGKRAHQPLNGQNTQQKRVYVGHLHHYSKSLPMVWDPKTKLVSPQIHVMFDDNFDTVQAPDPNIKQADTMDRLFKTNRYTYDDPFGNEHTYLFSHGGADIHPENLTPIIETYQASFTMMPCSDTQHNNSTENNPNNKSILSMQYLIIILHVDNIHPQSSRDDFKAYKH
jgi:hypothetical protein